MPFLLVFLESVDIKVLFRHKKICVSFLKEVSNIAFTTKSLVWKSKTTLAQMWHELIISLRLLDCGNLIKAGLAVWILALKSGISLDSLSFVHSDLVIALDLKNHNFTFLELSFAFLFSIYVSPMAHLFVSWSWQTTLSPTSNLSINALPFICMRFRWHLLRVFKFEPPFGPWSKMMRVPSFPLKN